MDRVHNLAEELERCVRCGTCRTVCPVFASIQREPASARGRISLIKGYVDGEIAISQRYLKSIKECTLCGACAENCPNGVDIPEAVLSARIESVEKRGLPSLGSFILKSLLDSSRLLPFTLRVASRLQPLVFRDSPLENGLVSRFNLPFIDQKRLLPTIARTFFLERPEVKALSSVEGDRDTSKPRVGFFVGCGINYLLPRIGDAVVRVLKNTDSSLLIPQEQSCCGVPALSAGDLQTAKSLAMRNIETFERYEIDYITTGCATCSYTLRVLFPKLFKDDPEMKKRAHLLASRVVDITELLIRILDYRETRNIPPDERLTVTYHDPCHLSRYQHLKDEPREIILRSGHLFKEMPNPCACCGLGGGVNLTNYELSMDIARRKVESIRRTSASVVATACPGCMVQLNDGLHRYGVDAKVVHVVELL